jgi:predicted nucleic acid-binding protein
VVAEDHSTALRAWALDHDAELIACDLIRTELLRAARRLDPSLATRAQAIVDAIDLVPIPRHLFRAAGLLDPPGLRTLDGLHLAAALELGDDLDGIVTYDGRMAEAARARAITVVRPV